MGMTDFYSKAGRILKEWIEPHGTAPQRTFVLCYQHERGFASFDGRVWHFHLNTITPRSI